MALILNSLFVLLFLSSIYTCSSMYLEDSKVDCNDLDKMDRAALVMTAYGDRNNSKPLTPEEVESEYCVKVNRASEIIKLYAKQCFKPFPRQIIGLLVRGTLKQAKKVCNSQEEREIFSRHSQCLLNLNPEDVHKCMDRYIVKVESIRDNLHDLDLKLPFSCCYFWDFKQCIRDELAKGCPEEAVTYADDNITKASSDSLDLTCKNYEEFSPNCDTLPNIQRNKRKTHISYLPALVDIFTNL